MCTTMMVCVFCSNITCGWWVCLPVSEQEEYELLDVKLEGDTRAASERLRCVWTNQNAPF